MSRSVAPGKEMGMRELTMGVAILVLFVVAMFYLLGLEAG